MESGVGSGRVGRATTLGAAQRCSSGLARRPAGVGLWHAARRRLDAAKCNSSAAFLYRGARCSRHRSRQLMTTLAGFQLFPFDEKDYYRAHLQIVQASDPMGIKEGTLVFMKEGETLHERNKNALVLSVAGDTLAGITNQIQRLNTERPMALDLLWKVLTRGQEISKRDWRLARVAIVELRNNVYYGRLFFGEEGSDRVVWDCDCRPSDACWLSLKAECPIFIKKDVWEAHSVAVSDLMSSQEEGSGSSAGVAAVSLAEAVEDTGTALLTKIRTNDPDPIKRLKREMEVALQEEDYGTAARIRDHPFMQLHMDILRAHKEGKYTEAEELEARLQRAIEDSENARGS